MRKLSVYVEINGKSEYVGEITGTNSEDAHFTYDTAYLNDPEHRAISIGLPLEEKTFNVMRTRIFFEGLLPEGYTRRCVAKWMHMDENDYLSILAGLGRECLGAIRVIENSNCIITPEYRELSEAEVYALASEGATESAELVTKSHLSLTGASGKVGLYYNEIEKKWYLPIGEAPSTHIVKQSHVRLKKIVVNEQLCLLTAKNNIMNGLPVPCRLHQEDFAQALGIASVNKYEKKQEGYMKKLFDVIRAYSADPMTDSLKLWDICIFNYLIGNTDNHIKNLSLLYGEDMKSIRLAPAYDIVSTMIYKNSTEDMALSIDGKYNINEISRESFGKAATQVGIGSKIAMRRFDTMVNGFTTALQKAKRELDMLGINQTDWIGEQIMEKGGIKKELQRL